MTKAFRFTVFSVIAAILIWSCQPLIKYPITPELNFKSLELKPGTDALGNPITKGLLTITVVDGDGDIGLPTNGFPGFEKYDNKNLFIKMMKKTKEGFVEDNPLLPLNYRTPYLQPEGQDKSLIADLEVTLEFTRGSLPKDTVIKFDFFIIDRQFHLSNTAETPEFKSDTLGLILPR
jgi:hypothetical protein